MKFDVWCPGIGGGPDDARTFDAFDAECAASEWARWEDARSADYWIVGGENARVCVRAKGGTAVHEFIVQGRMERVYISRALPANLDYPA